MKKLLLTILLAAVASGTYAQAVNDDVIIGAGYANQVWYSLDNDEQGSAPKDNWDIAFNLYSFMAPVYTNTVTGTMLWNYPKGDRTVFGTALDTSGLSGWMARYNSDTSWSAGAMGRYADPNDPEDLDWGLYNMSTHIVAGDSVYIIQLANGDFKQLLIESLSGGVFTFKYADLDGSNAQTKTIKKSDFPDKNFAYFSIQNNAALPANREPDNDKWDLLFTQYTGFVPTPYNVTGVLHNRNVTAVKVTNLPDKANYKDWGAQTFVTPINTIGYNWKSFNGSGYDIKDSTVYFVTAVNQDIWKIIFTGFDNSNGKMSFSKEKVWSVSVKDANNNNKATVGLYPNPSFGQAVNVVYDIKSGYNNIMLAVTNLAGRLVYTNQLDASAGMHYFTLPSDSFVPSMYIVTVNTGEEQIQQKLIVR